MEGEACDNRFYKKQSHTKVLGMEFTMMVITYFIIICKLGANVLKAVPFILNCFSLGELVVKHLAYHRMEGMLYWKMKHSADERDTREIYACHFVILFEQEL